MGLRQRAAPSVGLQIAVDDARPVRGVDRLGRLADEVDRQAQLSGVEGLDDRRVAAVPGG